MKRDFTFDLAGKVALVTGASGGIGGSIARQLAESGANLVLTDLRKKTKTLDALAAQLSSTYSVQCSQLAADLTNRSHIDALIGHVLDTYGSIDLLVNAAGMYINRPIVNVKEQTWDDLFNVNLKAVFLLSKSVARLMVQQKNGVIINICSDSAVDVAEGDGAYAASKVGVAAFTRHLAKEVGPANVRVNSIAPGWTKTEMTEFIWSNSELLCEAEAGIPLGYMAEPDEIGNVALFLASNASNYITGQMIVANGGRV